MPTLDTILNWVLPPLVIIVVFWLMISPFTEQLGKLINIIKNLFKRKEEDYDVNTLIRYE